MPRTPLMGRIRSVDGKRCIEYRAQSPTAHFDWAHEIREGHSITDGLGVLPVSSVVALLTHLDHAPGPLVYSNPMDPVQCADERRDWIESLRK